MEAQFNTELWIIEQLWDDFRVFKKELREIFKVWRDSFNF